MKSFQTIGVALTGGLLVFAGLIMLVIPGPGLLTIAAGVAIWATKFQWAKKLLARVKLWLKNIPGRRRTRRP